MGVGICAILFSSVHAALESFYVQTPDRIITSDFSRKFDPIRDPQVVEMDGQRILLAYETQWVYVDPERRKFTHRLCYGRFEQSQKWCILASDRRFRNGQRLVMVFVQAETDSGKYPYAVKDWTRSNESWSVFHKFNMVLDEL